MEAADVGLWKRVVDTRQGASKEDWMGAAVVGMGCGGRWSRRGIGW